MKPDFTVIIPHRESESIDRAVENLKKSDYNLSKIELLTVTGNQPSVQRNECIKQAKGKFIYFIDNDSESLAHNFKRANDLFSKSNDIAVVGGPNIAKEGDRPLQKEFAHCLSSRFGVGPVASRYKATGGIRAASDRELILCNLFIRKSVLDTVGLFKEELYPNEENDLMNRIQSSGFKLMYDPEIQVLRSPRPDYRSFVRMLMGYGSGRFKQMLLDFRFMNLIFFLPAFFVLYLFSLPVFIPVAFQFIEHDTALLLSLAYSIPFILYNLMIGAATAMSLVTFKHRRPLSIFSFPVLFISIHVFYGIGEWLGVYRAFFPGKKKIHFDIKKVNLSET